MIEKTLKTTEGKLRVKIPTQLHDFTLGQMIAMQENPQLNDIEAISILSGISTNDLYNVKNMEDFQIFGDAVLSLSYQIKYLYNSEDIPKEVTFMIGEASEKSTQKRVKVIQNL